MKKVFSILLVLSMVFALVPAGFVTASAAGSDFTYYVTASGVTIMQYVGSSKEVIIPNFLGGHPVTAITGYTYYIYPSVTGIQEEIYAGAFQDTAVTSVTIPNGVTELGNYVFSGCNGLAVINIPDSVTNIGDCAFLNTAWFNNQPDGLVYAGKTALQYKGTMPSNTTLTVNAGTRSLHSSVFNECKNLSNIILPDSLISIGGWAFYGCTGLTDIDIPDNVSSIGPLAFGKCSGLSEIVIPKNVTDIGSNAFYGCEGLTNIVIPDSVTNIRDGAFYGCTGLTNIVIPDSVTNIGDWAFSGCTALTDMFIPAGVTSIGKEAFMNCAKLTSAYFFENAPAAMGTDIFTNCAAGFTVYCITGKTGFSEPWNLYTTAIYTPVFLSFDSNGGTTLTSIAQRLNATVPSPTNPVKAGSTFSGWYSDAGLTVAVEWPYTITNSTTFYAKWTEAEAYIITFDANGGTGGTSGLKNTGDPLTSPVVTKSGYTLSGWSPSIPPVVPANDATYKAQWIPKTCRIIYSGNGSTAGSTANSTHIYDAAANLTANGFTKTGYSFLGWSTSSDAVTPEYTDAQSVINITPYSFTILYAVWSANQYQITFNGNGGTGGTSSSMACGAALTAPAVTREGYTLIGWSPAIPSTVPAADTTYTAQWGINVTITFDANGGTGGTSTVMGSGTALTPVTVTKPGYSFLGWSPAVPSTVPATDTTYTAMWGIIVTFDANGGTGGTSKTLIIGSTLTAPTVTRTGYTFAGWSPSVPSTVPSENTTYTAQWTANTYTVTFNPQGGTVSPTSSMVTYNSTYGAGTGGLPTPTRSGYIFGGWYKTASGAGGKITSNSWVLTASAHTLYAIWTKITTYTVTFNPDGGSVSPATTTVTYGSTYGEGTGGFPAPTRTGYTFGGWYTGSSGTGIQILSTTTVTITAAQTLYAKWISITYTITYDGNGSTGGSMSNSTRPYEWYQGLTPNSYTKTGHTFIGWALSAGGDVVYSDGQIIRYFNSANGATAVTLYAKWGINNYTVTFDANGGTGGTSAPMTYGAALTAPSITKPGYIFTGWSQAVPATVGAENATYTAQWNLLGDIGSDNSINALDALMALQASSGLTNLTGSQKLFADVSKDGKVNSLDALMILKYTSGKITSFE